MCIKEPITDISMLSDLHRGRTGLPSSKSCCFSLCEIERTIIYTTVIYSIKLCGLQRRRQCFVVFCHSCCVRLYVAALCSLLQRLQSIRQRKNCILNIKMVLWLTMRPGLFCAAFMSSRLGPYVKYTYESWFLLFLTSELTKEDSCCAM